MRRLANILRFQKKNDSNCSSSKKKVNDNSQNQNSNCRRVQLLEIYILQIMERGDEQLILMVKSFK